MNINTENEDQNETIPDNKDNDFNNDLIFGENGTNYFELNILKC